MTNPTTWNSGQAQLVATGVQFYMASKKETPGGASQNPPSGEVHPVKATPGSPIWHAMGYRARTGCVVIYASKIRTDKDTVKTGGGKESGSAVTYEFSADLALLIGSAFDPPGKVESLRRLYANSKTYWKNGSEDEYDNRYDDIEVKHGGQAQSPSSIGEGIFGVGKVPADKDRLTVWIEDLELEDSGGSIPFTWEAIWEPNPAPYEVADALKSAWSRVKGRDPDADLIVTGATGKNIVNDDGGERRFWGLQIEGPFRPREVLEMIAGAYDLVGRPTEGGIEFFDRGEETVIDVSAAHLGAYNGDAPLERPFKLTRSADHRVPSAVHVKFLNRNNAYKGDEVKHVIDGTPTGTNILSVSLPMIFKGKKPMKKLARRLAYEAVRLRHEVDDFPLPPNYQHVDPGDILRVPYRGFEYLIFVEEVAIGNNFEVRVRGYLELVTGEGDGSTGSLQDADDLEDEDEDDEEAAESADDDDGGTDLDDGYIPGLLKLAFLDLPPLTDTMAEKAGVLYGHAVEDTTAKYKKASLFQANSSAGQYKKVEKQITSESPIGIAMNALPDAPGTGGIRMDLESELEIQLLDGAPQASAAGRLILVGDEILSYRNVALASPIVVSGVNLTVTGTNGIYERASGDFLADGFAVGLYMTTAGFANKKNNRTGRIIAVNNTQVRIDTTDKPTVAEGPVTGATITVAGDNAYVLSGLARGLRDTKDHMDSHVLAERVVLLDNLGALEWVAISKAKVGQDVYLKAVQKGQVLADVAPQQFTYVLESLRPFRPALLHYKRGGVDPEDLAIRWVHRTRLPDTNPTDTNLHPLLEKEEVYDVEVYSDSGLSALVVAVRLSFSNHDSNRIRKWTYDASAQSGDGLTPGDEVWVRIRQRGDVKKQGNWSDTLHVQALSAYHPPTGGYWGETATEGTVVT